jgi:cellulose synthase/poly-beta-1,6-N-acetylglucosamine synthase-like glycosyltransferase
LIVVLLNLKNKNKIKHLFPKLFNPLEKSIRIKDIFNMPEVISQKKHYDKNIVLENEKKNMETIFTFPYISILIASYNEKTIIDKLFYSIYNLDYDINKFETIIIDDSIDDTFTII